ncbi:transporter substrate-binding domain-containing protein [Vibrio sp. ZSDZ65]|uniref:Transporter substrate-binding domain-containing protein n=1 Tax=Vibrio qingdaonensis TaxID=2829491 RepID=A0A9X3CNN1_9VIBR|nr:transporter substrate-binding domain-containing protein [Vibrio qingdaonensis]MCW8346419.1 transporter substrate-binding domain-containing protein [Vibrio qingdaonensis]
MTIHFWNGNKSKPRQDFERSLLQKILLTTSRSVDDTLLFDDCSDYPNADDEGNIFQTGVDILVTVKGNQKFSGKPFIEINRSLTKALLGQRILFIRADDQARFRSIQSIKQLKVGIPETWVDAELFRHNGFNVVEKGNFDGLFTLLSDKSCDFVCFGANEALDIYQQRVDDKKSIILLKDKMILYPFPLVFYVNANRPDLAKRVEHGLQVLERTGEFEALYQEYFGDIENELALDKREALPLHNPFI